jgi:hypothetical protein
LLEEEKVAGDLRSKFHKFSESLNAILFDCRVLAAELGFTLVAFYGLYHVYLLLTK